MRIEESEPPRSLSPPPSSDGLEQLAALAAQGDEGAFEDFHRRLDGGLIGFLARRSGAHRQRAEELAQRTWIEVWRSLRAGKYDPARARPSTYVYGIGWKIVLRERRELARASARQAGARALESAEQTLAADVGEPGDALDLAELVDALRACLDATGTPLSLTAEERLIACRSADGEVERDLAALLSLAPSTVNSRKQKALRKLRLCLEAKKMVERPEPSGEQPGRGGKQGKGAQWPGE